MNNSIFDWKNELEELKSIPLLDGEEWDLMRKIDNESSKESRTIVVIQLSHQDHSTKS
jgi:hypothetical protein